MCAIFGTAGIANLKLIKEISQKQIFRGPDEQNFYVSDDNLVCLGNNRLSVIDKQNGKQPMFSSNKRFITVFNGCIYNFLEIKKYLKSKNINFSTNSDTEVVANAYMYFGDKHLIILMECGQSQFMIVRKRKYYFQEIMWVKNHFFIQKMIITIFFLAN